jgi:signal transduction histidine kinase
MWFSTRGGLSANVDVSYADGLLKIVVINQGKGFDGKEIFSEAGNKSFGIIQYTGEI